MTNINGFTDDELRKKYKIEEEIKTENNRILKEQREENDRLIDAIKEINKVPEPELTEEELYEQEVEREIDNERNELASYIEESKGVYSFSYIIFSELASFWDSYKKGFFAFIIIWIIGGIAKSTFITLVAFVVLIVTILIYVFQFPQLRQKIKLLKKSFGLKKTKVYDEIKKLVNTETFSQAKFISMHSNFCSFISLDDGKDEPEYYEMVDFEKLGYPELDYIGQIVLLRLVQKLIKKDIKREFIYSGDIEFANEHDKPYKKYYCCRLNMTDAEYRRMRNKEMQDKIKQNKKLAKINKKDQHKKQKSGETW